MKFAFRTAPQNTTWSELLALWQVADDIEVFESGWVFDHFYPIFSDRSGPCLEGWTVMTALAQATTRLRLGTLVTGIHHRHPAVLANMATALDIISGGRLEVGVGAGWDEKEAAAYGFDLGTRTERSDRLEEACAVLVGLMSQEVTTFRGNYYQLCQARNEPKGVQKPHPPICIGGNGERRTLRTAARFAQHWSFFGGTPQDFARKRDVLHAHCHDVGREPGDILLSSPIVFDGDPAATAASAAAFGEQGADLAIIVLRPPFDPAVLEPLADLLDDLRR
ncbi:luciferase-like protein [Mycolicibacterium canariasense]|uniref:Luciferase-like protein n=1 Tax=Mycolicibacterium canariasense TaxID=228230 RepID=A0A117I8W1_MYCCR|nr:LLM class F420-dependent oxidoreductase [Mycolicibacterium canariasense]MCV7212838.1 LLM class F420-dependent oxidoreductase [Mycolicibacterium canariasense]ORV12561.1 LLM class F420-dependent oxidoreductase [Mycolicibacterium canariasense]GAS93810.1 luciferase-like protein [Mycolicibacterium canariasense]